MNKQRKKPPVQLQGQDMRGTEEVSPRQKRPSRPRVDKIYGKHSVRALFMRRPDAVRRLVILSGKLEPPEEFLRLAEDNAIEPEVLPWTEFLRAAEVTKDDKHQGVCAFADPLTIYSEKHLDTLADASCILALDQITNPQNLATILRSAAFFGADAVLLLKNRAADMSPVVFRVAVGGAEFTKIFRVTNFA
ncbi:MAG: RNA methyltransferase, partial [Chromatiales bacterium]|nr:RNA methyltransferase [Chromatiales bacterium]